MSRIGIRAGKRGVAKTGLNAVMLCRMFFHILQHAAWTSTAVFLNDHKHLAPNASPPISESDPSTPHSGLSFSEDQFFTSVFFSNKMGSV